MKEDKLKKVTLTSKERSALRVFNERVYNVLKVIYDNQKPVFVEDIYKRTGITKPTIYYCIRVLKEQKLLDYTAQSRFRSYVISDKKASLVSRILTLVGEI
jgi:DNA-binding IclR family transcriptional regulator